MNIGRGWSVLIVVSSCLTYWPATGAAESPLAEVERLVAAEVKPFVVVEVAAENMVNRGQGVVISPQGHVLTAGHIAFVSPEKGFSDKTRISLRGRGEKFPGGYVHVHKTAFADREGAEFFEYFYGAELIRNKESRFFAEADLSVYRLKAGAELPYVEFFSQEKPKLEAGETLQLCHYNFPHQPADPTFLINPVKVVGMTQTPSGVQYLGEGYYRVGSSGGALLKNGRVIGIQSAAYTVNAKGGGETPLGLISFQLVWKQMFAEALGAGPAGEKTPAPSPP